MVYCCSVGNEAAMFFVEVSNTAAMAWFIKLKKDVDCPFGHAEGDVMDST